ncbi:conserved hypothetical protein [Trichinella spiralis]|uniref:hypothetical protein n=1 Tax=Trichinella spiralis TaxID=6334 RepID=UPI0001EFD8AF|nr:conserved hypothetical protein [Trichinella spiralis]
MLASRHRPFSRAHEPNLGLKPYPVLTDGSKTQVYGSLYGCGEPISNALGGFLSSAMDKKRAEHPKGSKKETSLMEKLWLGNKPSYSRVVTFPDPLFCLEITLNQKEVR